MQLEHPVVRTLCKMEPQKNVIFLKTQKLKKWTDTNKIVANILYMNKLLFLFIYLFFLTIIDP